jgi:prolipoprotein diacylglyceryl transferase
MQPVLLQLGPVTFYSFGVFAALAFAAGIYVTVRLAHRDNLSLQHLFDYGMYTAIAALIGARLWYLVFRPDDAKSFWELFTVGGGGLALPGGIVAGSLALAFVVRRTKGPVLAWLDIATIGTVVGLAVAKVGSLLNGDGFGAASSLPWAIEFTDKLAPGSVAGESVHPVQLYGVILYAALAFGLWKFHERIRLQKEWRPGSVFWAGLLGVAVIQLALEPFHSALDALSFAGDQTARVIYPLAVLVAVCSAVMLYRSRGPAQTNRRTA